jgi:hypothetical protein
MQTQPVPPSFVCPLQSSSAGVKHVSGVGTIFPTQAPHEVPELEHVLVPPTQAPTPWVLAGPV